MKVIVTGSLGHVGKPLVSKLVQKGHSVVVVSTNTDRQKDIEALGASAAVGSVSEKEFVVTTFAGADAVFALIPPGHHNADPVQTYKDIGANYAEAIRQHGIKRVVHLSSFGADLDHGTGIIVGSHHVETLLNKLEGTSVTHLRAGYFYYNLLNYVKAIKATGTIRANYGGDAKIPLVAPQDIAAVAFEELERSYNEGEKTVRYVASDEKSANEIIKVLGNALEKPDLQWVVLSDEQVRQEQAAVGVPAAITNIWVEIGASLQSGALSKDYWNHKPVLGDTKLEDFVKTEFVSAFSQSS